MTVLVRNTSRADIRLSSFMLRSAVDVVDLFRVMSASLFDDVTHDVAASSVTEPRDVTVWGTVLTVWGMVLLTIWGTVLRIWGTMLLTVWERVLLTVLTAWEMTTSCCFNKWQLIFSAIFCVKTGFSANLSTNATI